MAMRLASGNFILRPYRDDDRASFVAAVRESTATVGKWMAWAHPDYSATEAQAWFAHCASERAAGSSHEYGIFTATDGVFVGGAGLNQFNPLNGFCNLGYWVRESWQRKGAALAAIRALTEYGFSQLELGRIEIVVAENNIPSLALAERAGAMRECLARNRLRVHGVFTAAYVHSFVPPSP